MAIHPKEGALVRRFWERLIGLAKSTIKKLLGRAAVNLCTLQTIVVEVEAILNDRPLTYVSSDIKDEEALTPAHLLYDRRITSLPHPLVESDEVSDPTYQTNIDFLRKAKRVTLLIQHFWQRWRHEYLTSLREFHKSSEINTESVKVGHVVLIHDDSPRVNWKLALVTSINRGCDGLVRSVSLRTANGTTNRPITRLHPLEVQAMEVQCHTEDETTTVETPTPVRRPQRDAATVTLNVYFVSIRLICYLLYSSDFRSAVVTVFSLIIAYVTTRESTKHVFRSRQKTRT